MANHASGGTAAPVSVSISLFLSLVVGHRDAKGLGLELHPYHGFLAEEGGFSPLLVLFIFFVSRLLIN